MHISTFVGITYITCKYFYVVSSCAFMRWRRWLVTGLSSRRLGLNCGGGDFYLRWSKWHLGQILLQVGLIRFSSVIPSVSHSDVIQVLLMLFIHNIGDWQCR